MRLLVTVLGICLALGLLRLVVIAFVLALCLILLWAALTRPKQALGLIFFTALGALVEAYPGPALIVLAGMVLTVLLGKVRVDGS